MNDQINFFKAKLNFEIDSWDVFEKLNNDEKITCYTRSNEAYTEERIPGSINIPHRTMNEDSTKKPG